MTKGTWILKEKDLRSYNGPGDIEILLRAMTKYTSNCLKHKFNDEILYTFYAGYPYEDIWYYGIISELAVRRDNRITSDIRESFNRWVTISCPTVFWALWED